MIGPNSSPLIASRPVGGTSFSATPRPPAQQQYGLGGEKPGPAQPIKPMPSPTGLPINANPNGQAGYAASNAGGQGGAWGPAGVRGGMSGEMGDGGRFLRPGAAQLGAPEQVSPMGLGVGGPLAPFGGPRPVQPAGGGFWGQNHSLTVPGGPRPIQSPTPSPMPPARMPVQQPFDPNYNPFGRQWEQAPVGGQQQGPMPPARMPVQNNPYVAPTGTGTGAQAMGGAQGAQGGETSPSAFQASPVDQQQGLADGIGRNGRNDLGSGSFLGPASPRPVQQQASPFSWNPYVEGQGGGSGAGGAGGANGSGGFGNDPTMINGGFRWKGLTGDTKDAPSNPLAHWQYMATHQQGYGDRTEQDFRNWAQGGYQGPPPSSLGFGSNYQYNPNQNPAPNVLPPARPSGGGSARGRDYYDRLRQSRQHKPSLPPNSYAQRMYEMRTKQAENIPGSWFYEHRTP